MAFDAHVNFGYSTVLTPPFPPASGTTLTLAPGTGSRFPAVPFNAVVWPIGVAPLVTNAEIIRVTGLAGDVITSFTRTQEGTAVRSILSGDQIAAAITAKIITDIESALGGGLPLLTVDPAAPADDTWWAVRSGVSPAGSVEIKARIGGVTRVVAAITY